MTPSMKRVADLLKIEKRLFVGCSKRFKINSKSPEYVNQATAEALVRAGLGWITHNTVPAIIPGYVCHETWLNSK